MTFHNFEKELDTEKLEKEIIENKQNWLLSMKEPGKYHYIYKTSSNITVKIILEFLSDTLTVIKRG